MRSVWAVFAGVLFIIVVTTLVDMLLHAMGVYPPIMTDALAVLATAYRVVISIAGAWITAGLAPEKPLKHAVILGVVGTLLGTAGVLATWNMGLGPRWYPILLAVLAIPQCWLGGMIYETQAARRSAVPGGA